jgi:hypothetical protein
MTNTDGNYHEPTKVEDVTIDQLFAHVRRLTLGSALLIISLLSGLATSAFAVGRAGRVGTVGPTAAENSLSKQPHETVPYVLPTVYAWIRLEPAAAGRPDGSLIADEHVFYSLFADKAPTPDDRFNEQYTSERTTLQYLPGPDEPEGQAFRDASLQWSVPLRMSLGDYRALVTGVRRTYPAQWSTTTRRDHAGQALGPREEDFCYPSANDSIGEVVISVESTAFSFKAPPDGTRALTVKSKDRPNILPTVTRAMVSGRSVSVATARFAKPSPTQESCLIVSW